MHVFQDNKKKRFFKVTVQFEWCFRLKDPEAPLTNFNDGGGGGGATEVHILYPKKSQLQNLFTQKKITTFLSIPIKIP